MKLQHLLKMGMILILALGGADGSAAECSPEVVATWKSSAGFLSTVSVKQEGQVLRLSGWMGGQALSATWTGSEIRGWVGGQPLSVRFEQESDGTTKASGWLGRSGSGILTWRSDLTKKKEQRILIGGSTDYGWVSLTYWGASPKHPAERALNGFTRRNQHLSLRGNQQGERIELSGFADNAGGDLYDLDVDTCIDSDPSANAAAFMKGETITISQALMTLALVND